MSALGSRLLFSGTFINDLFGQKAIRRETGLSRATANRRWKYALAVIVWRLNGKRVPTKRSMEYVIRQAG